MHYLIWAKPSDSWFLLFCLVSGYSTSQRSRLLPTDLTSLTPQGKLLVRGVQKVFHLQNTAWFSMFGWSAAEHIEDWSPSKVKREEGFTFTPYSSLAFSEVMLTWLIIMLKCFVQKVSAAACGWEATSNLHCYRGQDPRNCGTLTRRDKTPFLRSIEGTRLQGYQITVLVLKGARQHSSFHILFSWFKKWC